MACGAVFPRSRQGWAAVAAVAGLLAVAAVLVGASIGSETSPTTSAGAVELAAGSPSTTAVPVGSTTSQAVPTLDILTVQSVTCSGQLEAYPCELLVDGDPATAWNAPDGGAGSQITLSLEGPAQVSAIVLTNHADDESLMRNARVAGLELHFGGTAQVVAAEVEGSHGPYRVEIPLVFTDSISIHIESTHPAEHYQGQEPYSELALAEIRVVGYRQG